MITTILVLVLSVLQIGRQRLTPRHAVSAAAAAAFCAAVIVPTAIPYRRSLEETHPRQSLRRSARSRRPGIRIQLSRTATGDARGVRCDRAGPWIWGEQTLYVGYAALALAIAGLLLRRARRPTPAGHEPARTVDTRWIATGACLVVVGFVLAKGFVSSQHVRLPLFHVSELPGLDFLKGLRATPRFSLLLYFGIMILSGAGAAVVAASCRSARSA